MVMPRYVMALGGLSTMIPRLALMCAWLVVATSASCAPSPTQSVAVLTSTPTATIPPSRPTATTRAEEDGPTPLYTYRIIQEYPHDPNAFTQGLVYEDGILYEGTGLTGRSSLRKVALDTGEVLQIHELAASYFGEGIAVVGNRIWQLTWQNQTAFLYDKETFAELDTVSYPTEGWGLTYDGSQLIMSDGTATLYFRDPGTFQLLGQVQVYDEHGPVVRLNELEYIEGQVFANVWQTDRIAIIDPGTGRVEAWLDLTGLLDPGDATQAVDVLNGIAYDVDAARLFVTGKLWPKLFHIEIVARSDAAFLPFVARR
jgi:glutamine cyclotransferase